MIIITPDMTIGDLIEKTNLDLETLQNWVEMLEVPPPEVIDVPGLSLIEGGKKSSVANMFQKKYGVK